jgi:hypothetical protein
VKYLYYRTHCSGRTGLSNALMSTELGVLLAGLTERALVLDGNVSPTANLVSYGTRVDQRRPSRPTDLVEMPVPWLEAEQIDLARRGRALELTDHGLLESVFYFPASLDIDSEDFRRFAQRRRSAFTYGGAYEQAPVLRLSGGADLGEPAPLLTNLGFYAPFLYVDAPTRARVHALLRGMPPQRHFIELADLACARLGAFNAVHVRRGDFKQTYGRTTLLRRPSEAVAVLEHNFARRDRLLILTDERDDPFIDGLVSVFPDSVFIDHFILDELGAEFRDLPHRDAIALAFLSQLVAARARDFVGTMTSTFTSLIQRRRGSAGLDERFKFLWNELPAPSTVLERGRTAINDAIPMRPDGTMIEQFDGPYSWNRFDPRLNSAWMREWPESFVPAS